MHDLFHNWKKYLILPAALILAVGLGAGCSDDDDDDNGNGPGNGNGVTGQIAFTFDGTPYTSDICLANYMIADNETSITSGDGVSWGLLFEFPGSSTGSFNTAGGTSAMLTFAPHMFVSEDFSVTISAYGGIDGAVTGTFSGTMVHITHQNEVKQITNGSFTAERLPNVN